MSLDAAVLCWVGLWPCAGAEGFAWWCSYADELLRNLYRWLSSPASSLYSPALKVAAALGPPAHPLTFIRLIDDV